MHFTSSVINLQYHSSPFLVSIKNNIIPDKKVFILRYFLTNYFILHIGWMQGIVGVAGCGKQAYKSHSERKGQKC